MSDLIACSSCHRHARTSDVRCPFCGVEMPKTVPVRARAAGRFGRAALIVAGATGVAAVDLAGCGDKVIMAGDAYGADVSIPDVHSPFEDAAEASVMDASDAQSDAEDAAPDADDAAADATGD